MALKSRVRTFHRVFYNPGSRRTAKVVDLARDLGVEVQEMTFKEIEILARRSEKRAVHQGIVADVSHIVPKDITKEEVRRSGEEFVQRCFDGSQ